MWFFYSSNQRPEAKVKTIYNLFADEEGEIKREHVYGSIEYFSQKLKKYKQWRKLNFREEEIKEWVNVGTVLEDYEFIGWLRDVKNALPKWVLDYKEDYQVLKERFKKI